MSTFHSLTWSISVQHFRKLRTFALPQLQPPNHERPYDSRFAQTRAQSKSRITHATIAPSEQYPNEPFDNILVRDLDLVGQRKAHWRPRSACSRPEQRRKISAQARGRARPAPALTVYDVSEEELHKLVDVCEPDSEAGEVPRQKARSLLPERDETVADRATQESQAKLPMIPALRNKLREQLLDEDTPHELLMETYRSLPSPGARYLPHRLLWKLFDRLSTLPHKSEPSRDRFLEVLTDAKAADLDIPVHVWTSAMSHTGRAVKRISNDEVQDSLNLWREMESGANVMANAVTFNVLFDIASKARKFVLADMIHRELTKRGLALTRFFRMSLINHHGLKGDSAAVRSAYHEFVASGNFVDSAVIACVIDAFTKCHEHAAAELTFERAKRLHASKVNGSDPPRDWRENRKVGRLLHRAQQMHPASKANAEAKVAASVAPGVEAYTALIRYFAIVHGNMERVSALLGEMESTQLPMHGAIFLYLFKGFTIHGGLLYTAWTRTKLEAMYCAFVTAVHEAKENGTRIYVSRAMVELCLGAFAKCTSVDRMREVWGELEQLWNPGDTDRAVVDDLVARLTDRGHADWADLPTGQRARSMHFYLR